MLFGKDNTFLGGLGAVMLAGAFTWVMVSYYSGREYPDNLDGDLELEKPLPKEYFYPADDPLLSLDAMDFRSLSVDERESRLEEFLWKDFNSNLAAERDHEYMIDVLKDCPVLDRYLADPVKLRGDLSFELGLREHAFRPKMGNYYEESILDIGSFSFGQLLRSYLMLEALKDQGFVDSIGSIIVDDLADPFSEHGGVVVFGQDCKPLLLEIPSYVFEQDSANNHSYSISPDFLKHPKMSRFHLHASSEDCSWLSGPSVGDMSDVTSLRARAFLPGESHGFVITKMAGDRFNIDYYGCDRVVGRDLDVHVLDLGVYEYNSLNK